MRALWLALRKIWFGSARSVAAVDMRSLASTVDSILEKRPSQGRAPAGEAMPAE